MPHLQSQRTGPSGAANADDALTMHAWKRSFAGESVSTGESVNRAEKTKRRRFDARDPDFVFKSTARGKKVGGGGVRVLVWRRKQKHVRPMKLHGRRRLFKIRASKVLFAFATIEPMKRILEPFHRF